MLAVKLNVWNAQIGVLFAAVGAAGIGLTVALTVASGPVQPATVTFNVYTPLAKVVAPGIVGFCVEAVKLFGPLQLYVAPAIVLAVKLKVEPTHIGELTLAVGAAGILFTVTLTVPTGPVQPATVALTE